MKKESIIRKPDLPKYKYLVRRVYKYKVAVRELFASGKLGNMQYVSQSEFEILAMADKF